MIQWSLSLILGRAGAYKLSGFRVMFFENVDSFVQQRRHQAEYTDGKQHVIHFENLAVINDYIAKTRTGNKKFGNDNADKAQTDVYFHTADN